MTFLRTLAAAMILSLAAMLPATAQSALDEILSTGVLKVGTTGDWNPMSVRDPATNSHKGYDVDVMTQLAADLEVELEFLPADWKTLVNAVAAGNYHITGSASISPPRMKAAGFSLSYTQVKILPFTRPTRPTVSTAGHRSTSRRSRWPRRWAPLSSAMCANGSRRRRS